MWGRSAFRMAVVPLLVWSALAQTDAERQTLPLKLLRGYVVVVQGAIGPIGKLNFIVDTGAVPSIVDRRVVRRLNLPGVAGKLSVFTTDIAVRSVVLPSVRLGPVEARDIPAMERDLAPLKETLGVRIDGMIGPDLLGRTGFAIDYENKKLVFGPADLAWVAVPLEAGSSAPIVSTTVRGSSLRLLLDTGARDLILFERRTKACLDGLAREGRAEASNLGGTSQLQRLWLPGLRLGEVELGGRIALLLETPEATLPDFDGLVGPRALDIRQLHFDLERHMLSYSQTGWPLRR